mmetsp:Transcript_144559/g.402832  ORF Transcript_144559/g.402832 Transcript_144559/m.402832 type:complete len:358 (+) Transcript_144559:462-1535(+)
MGAAPLWSLRLCGGAFASFPLLSTQSLDLRRRVQAVPAASRGGVCRGRALRALARQPAELGDGVLQRGKRDASAVAMVALECCERFAFCCSKASAQVARMVLFVANAPAAGDASTALRGVPHCLPQAASWRALPRACGYQAQCVAARLNPPVLAGQSHEPVHDAAPNAFVQLFWVELDTVDMLLCMLHGHDATPAVDQRCDEAGGCTLHEDVVGGPLHEGPGKTVQQPGGHLQALELFPVATSVATVPLRNEGASVERREELHAKADSHHRRIWEVQHRGRRLGHMRAHIHWLGKCHGAPASDDETHVTAVIHHLTGANVHILDVPRLAYGQASLLEMLDDQLRVVAGRLVQIVVHH